MFLFSLQNSAAHRPMRSALATAGEPESPSSAVVVGPNARWLMVFTALYCLACGGIFGVRRFTGWPHWIALQPDQMAAAGFFVCGILLMLRAFRFRRSSIFGGIFLEYAVMVPLLLQACTSMSSGRCSVPPGGLISFFLAALGIQLLSTRRAFRLRSAFVALAGSTIFGYGCTDLASGFAGAGADNPAISLAYGLIGCCLLLAAWQDPIRSLSPIWFNLAVGAGSLTANLALVQSLMKPGPDTMDTSGAGPLVLYAGLMATICLTVVAHYAQVAHRQATRLAALNDELLTAYDATLEGWARALELRDVETCDHSSRVMEMTVRLARHLDVPEVDIIHIRRGALLHDIGKIGIPDSILKKPSALNEEEWEVMRQHPEFACRLLDSIDYLEPALEIPRYHHEKWDGTGYPHGLKGETIPFAARLFAVVDVWDALSSDRPYRAAWSTRAVQQHLTQNAGTHFDPTMVDAFFELLNEMDNSSNPPSESPAEAPGEFALAT